MPLFFALILVIFAGLINGSFALPTKYMGKWKEENIWLNFSFWGFLVLPWISIFVGDSRAFSIFFSIPSNLLWLMLLGGVCFGIGQICFAFALRILGLGLAFVINIGLGTAGSALLPILLWHPDKLGTAYGYAILLGVIVFIYGVIMGAAAGKARDKAKAIEPSSDTQKKGAALLLIGLLLGLFAGVGSICQALTYTYVNPMVSDLMITGYQTSSFAAYNMTWVGIFTGAFIPYMLYFLILNLKNKSLSNMVSQDTGKYWFYTFIMGFFFWMSLVFFSKASQILGGSLAPVVAWPMFMIFIILTSNFWGWRSNEWENCGLIASKRMKMSIAALVFAVFVFAYANNLNIT